MKKARAPMPKSSSGTGPKALFEVSEVGEGIRGWISRIIVLYGKAISVPVVICRFVSSDCSKNGLLSFSNRPVRLPTVECQRCAQSPRHEVPHRCPTLPQRGAGQNAQLFPGWDADAFFEHIEIRALNAREQTPVDFDESPQRWTAAGMHQCDQGPRFVVISARALRLKTHQLDETFVVLGQIGAELADVFLRNIDTPVLAILTHIAQNVGQLKRYIALLRQRQCIG